MYKYLRDKAEDCWNRRKERKKEKEERERGERRRRKKETKCAHLEAAERNPQEFKCSSSTQGDFLRFLSMKP